VLPPANVVSQRRTGNEDRRNGDPMTEQSRRPTPPDTIALAHRLLASARPFWYMGCVAAGRRNTSMSLTELVKRILANYESERHL
jgi:hypothetical protein